MTSSLCVPGPCLHRANCSSSLCWSAALPTLTCLHMAPVWQGRQQARPKKCGRTTGSSGFTEYGWPWGYWQQEETYYNEPDQAGGKRKTLSVLRVPLPGLTCPLRSTQGSDLTQARGKWAREGCCVISGDCGRHTGYTPIHGITPVMWEVSRVPEQWKLFRESDMRAWS